MSRQSKQRSSKREDSAKSVRTQGAMSRLLAALASRRPKEKDPGRDEARARSSKKRCSSADAASFIAYDALYKDGIAEVEPGLFSQTVEFSDISYQSARKETQEQIFTTLSSLYNYFPAESSVQLTIVNTPIPRELIGKKVFFEPNDERTLGYVDEYNRILNDKMREGVSNLVRRRFLTYSVPAESVEAAVPKLSHIRSDIASTLARIRCDAAPLGGQERLEAISTLVRPGHTPSCDWDKLSQHPRLRTKDLIAPNLMDFAPAGRADAVEIDGMYASVLTLRDFGSVLEDHYLASIIDLPMPLAVSVHIAPIVQSEAIALVKRQIDWMDKEIIDEQTTAAKKGFSQSILTPEIRYAKEEAEELLDQLQNKNQRLFTYTGLVFTYADTAEALDHQTRQIMAAARQRSIEVEPLAYRQRQGMNSILPLGLNHVDVSRYMTTAQVAIQMPFASQELNQEGGGYYGQSKQSGNLVICNRKKLASPMGFVCGKPGSGKSFSVKREIMNTILAYPDDEVIVFDPAGEYAPVVEPAGGTCIRFSPDTDTFMNPFDLSDVADKANQAQLAFKIDAILALSSATMAEGREGLPEADKSIISRCVELAYMRCEDKGRLPVLGDFYELLLDQEEPEARDIALRYERYVKGALSFFNHQSNVGFENRITNVDFKDLSQNMRVFGMLTALEAVRNRMYANFERGVTTWLYIDEVQSLFGHPAIISYFSKFWARGASST